MSTEHRPECKLQTVNAKPKPNNYQSSAEVRPNVEAWPSRSLRPNIRPMFGVNRTSEILYKRMERRKMDGKEKVKGEDGKGVGKEKVKT